MAHSDDNVSHGGLLLEDRPTRRASRPAPHTDRWWLVEAPSRASLHARSGRGPAHHPSRTQTHSDGLPLGHLFEPLHTPAAGLSWPPAIDHVRPAAHDPAGHHVPHARGARPPLPRRRDLRNGRVAPPPPQVSGTTPTAGIALGRPAGHEFLGTGPIVRAPAAHVPVAEPLTLPVLDLTPGTLPRRRDLRRAEQQGPQSRRALRDARRGALTDVSRATRTAGTVARGAVLTGLVAVGVVTISGQRIDVGKLAPTSPDTTAELAVVPAVNPLDDVAVTGEESYWDAGPEVEAAVLAGVRDVERRQAAARKAAAKRAADKAAAEARAQAKAEALRNAQRNPRAIGKIMAAERGWTGQQWTCLNLLWNRESQWRWNADNPSSSAYGIPQALPGRKMASAGADWATNPVTQIAWGLDYIADRYGSPCNAWAHSESVGWY